MKTSEVAQILALDSAYSGRQVTDITVKAWSLALDPKLPYAVAEKALVAFYADVKREDVRTRNLLAPSSLNAAWLAEKAKRTPTEAQINRECEERGLTGIEAWQYRRDRLLAVSGGSDRDALPSAELGGRRGGVSRLGGLRDVVGG